MARSNQALGSHLECRNACLSEGKEKKNGTEKKRQPENHKSAVLFGSFL